VTEPVLTEVLVTVEAENHYYRTTYIKVGRAYTDDPEELSDINSTVIELCKMFFPESEGWRVVSFGFQIIPYC
jgi:hypothetical protein